MLQNATPLRKLAPWPPSLVLRLPSILKLLQSPHVLLTFDKVHNPLHLPRETTSERPKVSEPLVFLTFWLRNVRRATTACTFSTCQLPKVVRELWVLHILTWKCASGHNGVHFLDIAASKSAPTLVCFVHFDLETCFAPQRCTHWRHLNCQKWSKHVVLYTCWLGHVLHATAACNFSYLIWSHGSAPAALASLFFDPPEAPEPQIIGKTQCFTTFLPFSRTCIFFLFILSLLWSSLFCSSPLWRFPPLLYHLSILPEVWLLNFRYIHGNLRHGKAYSIFTFGHVDFVSAATWFPLVWELHF